MIEENRDYYTITGYTLVDITSTGVISDDTRYRNQQRNWETIKQALALRTQVDIAPAPAILEEDMKNLKFGTVYKGKQLVWKFTFVVDRQYVFGPEFEVLKTDFENVPVILNLAETAKIKTSMFDSSATHCNIYFEYE